MVSIEKDSASSELVGNKYFNVDKYKDRMKMTFETFLIEANDRGVTAKKKIYCWVEEGFATIRHSRLEDVLSWSVSL